MAKKKVQISEEERKQQQHQFKLKQLTERLIYISEPAYKFNIGDRVVIGNLEDVYVSEVLCDGKIYEIDYTSIDNNYGNPIRNEHQRMYVMWMDIRKYKEADPISLIQNDDIRINYSQRNLSDILSKVYNFGVNFEPDYQRELVWKLEDKIALIDSIFNNVDIGKFTYIHTDDYAGDFLYEVLDGKQRVSAIIEFYEDRFPYKRKYYSELSYQDRNHFRNYPISSAEIRSITEEQKLRYFIMLNTGGRVMSKEHLDKVKKMWEETK